MNVLFKTMLGEKNSHYYLKQFELLENDRKKYKVSWNWAAFFAGPLWALYRKMYVWCLVIFILNKLLGTLGGDASLLFNILILIVPNMVFALYANVLYRNHLCVKISKAIKINKTDSELLSSLKQQGGVNMWVVYVFISVVILVLLLLLL